MTGQSMSDRELETRLRAWYRSAVNEAETAPPSLRLALAALPMTDPLPVGVGLAERLRGRGPRVTVAAAGAASLPRFDVAGHLAALAQDPPAWPARTDAASLLALDLVVPRTGLASALPALSLRLEFLDYPGEWLLDLPLLRQDFSAWSDGVLRRLEGRAEAALIRALAPEHGLEEMRHRRGALADRALCSGPGKLCQALALTREHNGLALDEPPFALIDRDGTPPIVTGPRIGITRAVEQSWRYGLEGSPFLSRPFTTA